MLAGDSDRRIGRTAEIDRNAWLLEAADRSGCILEPVIPAVVRDWPRFGPDALQDLHVFIGACIPLILIEPVAIAMLIHIVAAADDMDRRTTTGNLIKRRKFAGREGWCDETRPMRDQEADPIGVRCGTGRNQETVRTIRKISDKQPIEPAGLGCLSEVADVAAIQHQIARRMNFRALPMMDHADEFDGHAL